MQFYVYDLETYPNIFTFAGKFYGSDKVDVFEMSTRRDDKQSLLTHLSHLQNSGTFMVGYNSLGFDYPILHDLLNNIYTFNFEKAYQLCQQIINSGEYGQTSIQFRDRIIPQIDLAKINHFDNKNKRTSLKSLQFAMRAESVEDLPFEPGLILTPEQMDTLIHYNIHDVTETERFLKRNLHLIEMRKELLDNGILTGDVFNFSDVKIGTEYLIKKIGRQKCFIGNKARQTFRESVALKDVILPKISFRNEPFQAVRDWFEKQIIYTNSKDPKPHLEAKLAGLDFHFGVGGAHASVESQVFESNDTHCIIDIDVTGMYPSVSIANNFAPEHLGEAFLVAYKQLKNDRDGYKKGTTMNATLKLASNAAFGNGDNHFSCFYDPRFPKQITVNGQLQILQLAEMLSLIPALKIIQVNTDGITAYVPRELEYLFHFWTKDWECSTGLRLEEARYSKMWIRDVNNYLALTVDGKIKRKGAYWYPLEDKDYDGVWNKDFSKLVVPKLAEQCLVHGWKPEQLIKLMTDPFDFMARYKTPSGASVYIGNRKMPKTVRYYVSKAGQPMKKISEPKGSIGQYKRAGGVSEATYEKVMAEIGPGVWDPRIHTKNKSKYEKVETSVESGYLVKECNKASDFNWADVDFDHYVEEIKKLIIT
ncbi:MAG: hypothetical protein ACKOX6_15870 [Bdellovibrio sp.]